MPVIVQRERAVLECVGSGGHEYAYHGLWESLAKVIGLKMWADYLEFHILKGA